MSKIKSILSPIISSIGDHLGRPVATRLVDMAAAGIPPKVHARLISVLEIDGVGGFEGWTMARNMGKFIRAMKGKRRLRPTCDDDGILEYVLPNESAVWFMWGRTLFRVFVHHKPSKSGITVVYTLYCYGLTARPLHCFIDSVLKEGLDSPGVDTYVSNQTGGWTYAKKLKAPSPDAMIYPGAFYEELLNDVRAWREREEFDIKNNVARRMTIVIEGPPGTGKTTLATMLAADLNFSLNIGTLQAESDASLLASLMNAGSRSVVVYDDFEGTSALKARDFTKDPDEQPQSEDKNHKLHISVEGGLTLSGIQAAIGGQLAAEPQLIVLTTNSLKGIDPAFLRERRVDKIYTLGLLDDADIRRYIKKLYPDDLLLAGTFKPMTAAKLHAAALRTKTLEELLIALSDDNK